MGALVAPAACVVAGTVEARAHAPSATPSATHAIADWTLSMRTPSWAVDPHITVPRHRTQIRVRVSNVSMKRLVHECLPARATLLVAATFALTACASPRGLSSSVSLAGDQPVAQAQPEEWDYVADDGVRHCVTEFGRGDTVVVLH